MSCHQLTHHIEGHLQPGPLFKAKGLAGAGGAAGVGWIKKVDTIPFLSELYVLV